MTFYRAHKLDLQVLAAFKIPTSRFGIEIKYGQVYFVIYERFQFHAQLS